MATDPGEGKLNSNLIKRCLKIDLLSHPACVEGLGKYII